MYNHADCRLLSRRALDALSDYREVNLFLRGIVPDIGLKSDLVYFERAERFAGESKYPFKKMLSFALQGVTSFSVKPLKLITSTGILFSVLSLLAFIAELVVCLCGIYVAPWVVLLAAIWLVGGIQLICLGVAGEYIGKIYSEVKARPRFLVEKILND